MTIRHIGLLNNGIVDRTYMQCDGAYVGTTDDGKRIQLDCGFKNQIDIDALLIREAEKYGYPSGFDVRQAQIDAYLRAANWTALDSGGVTLHYCREHWPEGASAPVAVPLTKCPACGGDGNIAYSVHLADPLACPYCRFGFVPANKLAEIKAKYEADEAQFDEEGGF